MQAISRFEFEELRDGERVLRRHRRSDPPGADARRDGLRAAGIT
jgi:hypothetical protein